MADQVHDSLLKEIDEELRQEHYAKLWKKYGNYVIGAAVLLVVAVAGYQGWRHWDLKNRQEMGDRFAQAITQSANAPQDAAKTLSGLAEDGGGYGLLARFQQAALLAKSGDTAGAAAAYEAIAKDGGTDALYQNLATLLSVLTRLQTGDPDQLSQQLAPLTAADNPWRYSAQEAAALLALRGGDTARARELLDALIADAGTPSGIRARAEALRGSLG
ncbi:MAG: tetratricopeptide repeat protein [Hyphomicrobiales bacterium]|nr:tetratricopeptide repeat protein [Hyphomicrobiales bacterium]MCP5374001.1 tetratricopeptide repeat protein [Hyphomicrobiales bacterium]